MKINVSIEARMTSSRLPGKVLMPVLGKPMLQLMIERVQKAKYVNDIIVATTTNDTDDPVEKLCRDLNISVYRGSEHDVLERVYSAHKQYSSNVVVELTGDCPLIEPQLIDLCILTYLNQDLDYVATNQVKTYPNGQAVQVFSFLLLEYLNTNALSDYDREHVSPSIYQNPDKYRLRYIDAKASHHAPDIRTTLDTPEDFRIIKNVYEKLYPENPDFTLEEMIPLIRSITK